MMAVSPHIVSILNGAATSAGIEPALLRAVAWIESRGNPDVADSKAGAIGLLQLMSFNIVGIDARDPAQNARRGAQLLANWIRKYNDVGLGLAAYNWGPGNLEKNNRVVPLRVLDRYVLPVFARLAIERANDPGGGPVPLRQAPGAEPALPSYVSQSHCPSCGAVLALVLAGKP